MVDLETLGTTPDCVVLSLGACFFTREGLGNSQEWILNAQAQMDAGRKASVSTIAWWTNQSADARAVLKQAAEETRPMATLMGDFVRFVSSQSDPTVLRVWSCGSNFDTVIIEHLLRQLRIPVPWHFGNVRCYRTLKSMYGIENAIARAKTAHKALEDAKYQAECAFTHLAKYPEADK